MNSSVSMKSSTTTERGIESSNGFATVNNTTSAALATAVARRMSHRSPRP
jgi:hypothetical protein